MRLNEIDFDDVKPFDGYGPNFFRIGGEVIEGPVLATHAGVNSWGGLEDREALLALADKVDVIFIGMGKEIAHIPADLRKALERAGLGVEVMSSPAAARTYNVLLSEGRRIAAALLTVGE
ncbi:Mth938-like domain-containing protein [Actibacterium pelagium]|uniref:Membrane protein n=1 Tax=Actibacterium pelagium TaxID=2029103 RepID=A0A917EHD3_9RHOB|nr:Mth938-like domain-containing protein [Actibacterium pelagium]GGE40186.1 membrane protein [Actibacterium pelagium]